MAIAGGGFQDNRKTSNAADFGAAFPGFAGKFGPKLKAVLGSPGVRVGSGILAGVPLALSALSELGERPDDRMSDLAGVGGSIAGGGLAGGAAAALAAGLVSGPAAVVTTPLAFAAGSALGSGVGADLARGAKDFIFGTGESELDKQIKDLRKMKEAEGEIASAYAEAMLPTRELLYKQQLREAQRTAAAQAAVDRSRMLDQALLGAAMGEVAVNPYANQMVNAIAQM